MTKAQQKEMAIASLARTYYRNCTGVQSENEAREFAEHVWYQAFFQCDGGHSRAIGAVKRAEYEYEDM